MNLKIFIVCLNKQIALDVAKKIVMLNDDLSISPMFTTDSSKNTPNDNYEIYLDVNTVNLSYKNNSLLYIMTNKYISTGITIDDFYNNDLCIMNINEYNLISEHLFNKYDILTVWIDTKKHGSLTNTDLTEIKYFNSFLEKTKYLYFLEDESNISDTILDYIKGDEDKRQYLLKENS